MIERLKEETKELHNEVEQHTLARHIMDHTIDLEMYRLLLWQNYIAYAVTEKEIAQHIKEYRGEKHLRLKKDLHRLNISQEIPAEVPIFECRNKAEAYGATYVVEGSALGGMLLARNLEKCDELKSIPEHHFFNGDKNSLQEWKNFKESLSAQSFSEAEKEQSIAKAKETFEFFGEILQMEPRRESL